MSEGRVHILPLASTLRQAVLCVCVGVCGVWCVVCVCVVCVVYVGFVCKWGLCVLCVCVCL